MKVGDMVKMAIKDDSEFDAAEWGTGIILSIEISPIGGDYDAEVMWSEIGIGWESTRMLEVIDES